MSEYKPEPINTKDVQLPRDLYPLMEELSRSNHDTWSMHRLAEGWSYGSKRDDKQKQNPCLVPYNELPEIEKEYDRNTTGETLKSIYKLGFSITKRITGNVMVVGNYTDKDKDCLIKEAKKHDLSLVFFNDWESAQNMLSHDLSRWNSIVLDTIAKLQPSNDRTEFFLRNVLDDITALFNRNRNEVPWFIMPSQYIEFTDTLIKYTVGREREEKDWGLTTFKLEDCNQLFYNIAEILPNTRNYRIKCVYNEVFDVLEKLYPKKTKDILTNILLPLHYPEIFHSFDPTDYYNGLRRILESTFEVCNKYGLIHEEACFHEKNGSLNLRNCCRYLTKGEIPVVALGKKVNYIQIGKPIFPQSIGAIIKSILDITNEGSHMSSGLEYKTDGLYFSITSYALQLCDVIIWLGKYVKSKSLK